MSTRPGHHAARTNKGHPRRQARRDRAAERLRAHGGPVVGAGAPYTLGENGPELFIPYSGGWIIPSAAE